MSENEAPTGADAPPGADLTAILVRSPEANPEMIRRAVEAIGYGDVWLRIHRLDAVDLFQVEAYDPVGQGKVNPALVQALSAGGRAAFVHCNRAAGQAIVHAFERGAEIGGWMGAPAEVDAKLEPALGVTVARVVAADDGSRTHPFIAASDTYAIVRGRAMRAIPGLPIMLGNLVFHDRGYAKSGADRVALVAYDAAALQQAWNTVPGRELAGRLARIPESAFGPLAPLREAMVHELAALGDATPEGSGHRSVRALELLLLSEAYLYAGGDAAEYVDQRFLPIFSLAGVEPPFDDADEAEALEERASVLEAMVEVMPFRSPEGTMLEQIDDAELRPLAPWSKPGEEYVGAIFALEPGRLRALLNGLDQRDLVASVDRFYRAWWKVQSDEGFGDEFKAWRQGLEQKGADDINRFLTHWAEWRVVLETAAANGLQAALVFYG